MAVKNTPNILILYQKNLFSHEKGTVFNLEDKYLLCGK